MPPISSTCLNCKYWEKILEKEEQHGCMGYCHRQAPPRKQHADKQIKWEFPIVCEFEWCGDFTKK